MKKLFECVDGNQFKLIPDDFTILENLVLKRYENKLVVVSDEKERKTQSVETFRNKERLKAAGFKWDSGINSWTIDQSQLRNAQEVLRGINKTAMERFIDKLEEIPEFLANTENLSKKDELTQKIEGFVEELSVAVDKVALSTMVKNYLEFNAKFRDYSFYNTLLIYLQRKDATKVAGYRQWEEKFHRRVKKGAKGISILAPITVKKKDDIPTTTVTAPQPVPTSPLPTPGGSPTLPNDDKTRRYMRFMAVTVFDIKDTEAIDEKGNIEEPDWHGSNEPNQKANELFDCAKEMSDEMGIKIDRNAASGGEQGWASGGHINISSTVEGVNKAATVIHEIAHELLHFKKSSPFYIGDEENVSLSKETKELQAESVSFVIIRHYGLPATHQATYLALWNANKNSIKQNLTIIKKVSYFIIDALNKIRDEHTVKKV